MLAEVALRSKLAEMLGCWRRLARIARPHRTRAAHIRGTPTSSPRRKILENAREGAREGRGGDRGVCGASGEGRDAVAVCAWEGDGGAVGGDDVGLLASAGGGDV